MRVPAPGRVASQACPRPDQVRRGIRRRGWTDEAIAADALDVSASNVGRWRCQAVAEGPEAVLERQAKVPQSSCLDGAGAAQLL